MIGLVISQLDYANSLYIGLPDCDVKKLQRVQNIAAKTALISEEKRITFLPKEITLASSFSENKIQGVDSGL